jgi:RecA/RadA recombinase
MNGAKDGKDKAIGLAIAQIERQFGKGAIMRLGAEPAALDIAVISTGAISLDVALGVGGVPRGRVTEIFGPEASGKTTLALHLIAEVQKAGGNALKFYASVRLDVRRISQIKEGDEVTSSRVRVKVVKNKVAPPFRQAEFDMMYGEGISREGDLLDLASERGLVHKSGAWYAYQENRIGQGRENAKKYLKEHPELAMEIEQQLRQTLGLARVAAEPPARTAPNDELWDDEDEEA